VGAIQILCWKLGRNRKRPTRCVKDSARVPIRAQHKFLQVQNKSAYDPQPKNPKGEIHEDWGFLSFDKSRKKFLLRQFHVEGFVSEYVMSSSSADGKTIVFTTESIENIPAGFRAREAYRILGPDKFVEVFEIAEPGKDFELYSENHYRRIGQNR